MVQEVPLTVGLLFVKLVNDCLEHWNCNASLF